MKIRLPVIILGDGEWACYGAHFNNDQENCNEAYGMLEAHSDSITYWIEIDLPMPQPREVKIETSLKGNEGDINLVAVEVT